jgi:hypothetical protein
MVRIGSARSDYSQGEAMAALSGFDDAIQSGVKPRILSGTSRAADYFPKIISNVSARGPLVSIICFVAGMTLIAGGCLCGQSSRSWHGGDPIGAPRIPPVGRSERGCTVGFRDPMIRHERRTT